MRAFSIALAALWITSAGAAAKPAAAQPSAATEPTTTEPTSTEPTSTDPTSAEPTTAEPGAAEASPESFPSPLEAEVPDAIDRSARTGPPPARLAEWRVEGRLLDSLETVRGLLKSVIRSHPAWTDADQQLVVEYLLRLGYHSIIRNEALPGGGVRAVLVLEPVTLVRHVDVDIDLWFHERFRQPLFADELRRRMTLRPGSPLELDRSARSAQLEREAERLATYLRNDGFYEATVEIRERRAGEFASALDVDVSPGPPYFVGKLEVVGNSAIESERIVELFHHDRLCIVGNLCFGTRRFSRQTLNQDVQRLIELYQKRGYPGVRVRTTFDPRHSFQRDTQRVEFTIEIRERRKIDVVFEGNDPERFPEEDLLEILTLSEEGSYDDVEVEASSAALRRYYQSQGYFEANIIWERVSFGFFERIVFTIDEGPKLQVRNVVFHGNRALSDKELRAAIRTQIFQRIIIGASGGYATEIQLRQDLDRLRELYRSRGYPDAEVRVEVARDPVLVGNAAALAAAIAARVATNGLYVHFFIDEGPKVVVGNIEIEYRDEPSLPMEQVREVVSQRLGSPFLEEAARSDGEALRRFYFSQGFPRAEVETEVRRAPGAESAIVVHSILENSPARIGKIALRGNFRTRDWVLLQELRLAEGTPLTIGAAESAQANLRQSGLFSAVQIDYIGLDDPTQEIVHVLLQVEERFDGRAFGDVGGGYSTDTKLFTEVGGQVPNIFGIGARFDTRLTLGEERQSIDGRLAFPRWIMRRLTGTGFLFEASASYRNDKTERFGDLTSFGGSVAATKEGRRGFLKGWLLSLRYDFRQRQRDVDFIRTAGNSGDITQTKVTTRSSSIGPILVIDKRRDAFGRQNPLTPAAGFRLQVKGAYAEDALIGTDRFIKLGTSGQHFVSFHDRFILANGVRYDHGIALGGAVLLPEVERFFAGGDTTVRGFEEDRLATELIEADLPPLVGVRQFTVLPAGGNIRMIHNIDLQVALWNDPWFDFPIASAIFADSGLVTQSLSRFQLSDLRHSLGVALMRWVLPFGSFSVEYAMPLDPQRGDNPRGRFHVNLGVLF